MQFNNITKAFIINFCGRFHLYIHAYALLLQDRGLTLLQISTIESVVIGTVFLMEVPTGVLADRLGRKWSIVASVFLMMCAETLFIFSREYVLYLFIALLTGTGFAFASGATESLIYDSLPSEDRDNTMKRTMGQFNSMGQIAFFIAPVVGGLIIGDMERFTLAIALTAGVLFIGVLVSLTLKEPPTDWEADKPNTLTIFRNGINEIRGNQNLQRLVLFTTFTSAFTGTLVTTLAAPYMVQNGVSTFNVGLALSLGSLLAAMTQRLAYRVEQRLGLRWGLTVLALMPSFGYLLLSMLSGSVFVWLWVIFLYGTNDMKAPLLSAYQNAQIQSSSRATVLSLISMVVSLFIAIMAPVYAAIATHSLPMAFITMGLVILIGGSTLRMSKVSLEVKAV